MPVSAGNTAQQEKIILRGIQKISDAHFGFSVAFPKDWSITKEEKDKYSLSYTLEPTEKDPSVYVSAVDFKKPISLTQLKRVFDNEITKELDFLNLSTSMVPSLPVILDQSIRKPINEVQLNQYSGNWDGHPVNAHIGYVTKGDYGYVASRVIIYQK